MTDRIPSSDLASDEKLCPFCAETIKKAAIRCRYCHSDLSETPAMPLGAPPPAAGPVAAEQPPTVEPDELDEGADETADQARASVSGAGEQRGRGTWLSSGRLTVALLVLCLVLAVATALGWYRSQHPADAGSSNDAITSTSARDSGLQAATRLTEKIFSYDWKTFDQDASSSEKALGASFRKEYAATIAKTRQSAVANQVKQTARASASSIVSASDHKVVALVFMDVSASGKTGGRRVTTSRLLVTLTPADGDWRISQLKQL